MQPAGIPALGHDAAEAGLGALYEEIPLELRHRIDHMLGELALRAGEIDAAERQALSPDARRIKFRLRGCDIHGVPPETVELGDDQDITGLEPVGEPPKFQPIADGDAYPDGLGDDAVRLDPESAISCTWFSVVRSAVETPSYPLFGTVGSIIADGVSRVCPQPLLKGQGGNLDPTSCPASPSGRHQFLHG